MQITATRNQQDSAPVVVTFPGLNRTFTHPIDGYLRRFTFGSPKHRQQILHWWHLQRFVSFRTACWDTVLRRLACQWQASGHHSVALRFHSLGLRWCIVKLKFSHWFWFTRWLRWFWGWTCDVCTWPPGGVAGQLELFLARWCQGAPPVLLWCLRLLQLSYFHLDIINLRHMKMTAVYICMIIGKNHRVIMPNQGVAQWGKFKCVPGLDLKVSTMVTYKTVFIRIINCW